MFPFSRIAKLLPQLTNFNKMQPRLAALTEAHFSQHRSKLTAGFKALSNWRPCQMVGGKEGYEKVLTEAETCHTDIPVFKPGLRDCRKTADLKPLQYLYRLLQFKRMNAFGLRKQSTATGMYCLSLQLGGRYIRPSAAAGVSRRTWKENTDESRMYFEYKVLINYVLLLHLQDRTVLIFI